MKYWKILKSSLAVVYSMLFIDSQVVNTLLIDHFIVLINTTKFLDNIFDMYK